MIFTIAFRNILRHKRRTFLSALTIAVALTVFIAMNSLLAGMDRGAIDNMVQLSTGALKLTTAAYDQEKSTLPLNYGLTDRAAVERMLRTDPRVAGVTPRTQFLAQLSNYTDVVPVVGTVIDPAADTTVFSLQRHLQGAYFSADNGREIILGTRLAGDLGVKVGDYITLYALTRYESRNADEFRIVGLLNTSDPMLNRGAAFVTYKAANDFLDLDGLITELDASLRPRMGFNAFLADVKDLQRRARSQAPQLAASSFLDIGAAFFQLSRVKGIVMDVFLLIIVLIAAVGIFNTVFMSVFERIREIGVLRAHGMRPSQINLLFLLEGVFTGFAGGAAGVVLGALANLFLTVNGVPLDRIAGDVDLGEIPIWGTVYGQWNPEVFVFVFVFGIAVATLAAIIPAHTAGKMEVTRALRFA